MCKLAVLFFLFSDALAADVIQLDPNDIEITGTLVPSASTGSNGSYSASFEAEFYFVGPSDNLLMAGAPYPVAGPSCSFLPVSPDCYGSSSNTVYVNGDEISIEGYEDNGYGADGIESGTGDTSALYGMNTATLVIQVFAVGSAQNTLGSVPVSLVISDHDGTLSLIPEPSTWVLAAFGVASAIAWRRRKLA